MAISAPPARSSHADKVDFVRTFKVGDVDTYKFSMTAGPSSLTATFTDTVSRVYGNGDADVAEKATGAVATTVQGPKEEPAMNEEISLKVTKFGEVLGKGPGSPASMVLFTLALPGPNDGLAVNDSVSFKRGLKGSNTAEVPPEVSGTVTLVSVANGEAKLKVTGQISSVGKGQPSSEINGTLIWDTKLGRYTKENLTITNKLSPKLPISFSVERVP